jgi:hypothetical protein
MLQHCSSVGSCMRERIAMKEHYSGYQHSTPFFWTALRSCFSVSQYISDIIVAPCYMNSTISTPFLFQKQMPSAFWQTFVYTLSACLVNVYASTALTAYCFQHSQMKPRFCHLSWCDWEIHCHLCGFALRKSTKAKAILCVLWATVSIFGTHLAQNLWQPSLTVISSQRKVHEMRTKVLKLWRTVFHIIFSQQFEQDHHSLQMADHFDLHHKHLFAHLWTFHIIVLQFLHALHFGCKPHIIHDGFLHHSCLYRTESR